MFIIFVFLEDSNYWLSSINTKNKEKKIKEAKSLNIEGKRSNKEVWSQDDENK